MIIKFNSPTIFKPQRRQFLKTGLLGSATLTLASCGITLDSDTESRERYLWLQSSDEELLSAIIPVMLKGALPGEENEYTSAVSEIVKGIDISIAHMPVSVRDEVRQLFSLLERPITRVLFAGVWSNWGKAGTDDISGFLVSWKTSGFDLLRVGYTALHDLMTASWYANPRSWSRVHYPGPPKLS